MNHILEKISIEVNGGMSSLYFCGLKNHQFCNLHHGSICEPKQDKTQLQHNMRFRASLSKDKQDICYFFYHLLIFHIESMMMRHFQKWYYLIQLSHVSLMAKSTKKTDSNFILELENH